MWSVPRSHLTSSRLGFNGASAFGANLRAIFANFNSVITGMFSAITWTLLDFRLAKKYSAVGFCSGLISGLVAATPASGFIPLWASAILGVVTGIGSNYGTKSMSSPRLNGFFEG